MSTATQVEFELDDFHFTADVTREWEPPTWPERGQEGFQYFEVENVRFIADESNESLPIAKARALCAFIFPTAEEIEEAAIEAYKRGAARDLDYQGDLHGC